MCDVCDVDVDILCARSTVCMYGMCAVCERRSVHLDRMREKQFCIRKGV